MDWHRLTKAFAASRVLGSWSHFYSALTKPNLSMSVLKTPYHIITLATPFSLPQQQRSIRVLSPVRNHHRDFPVVISRSVGFQTRSRTQLQGMCSVSTTCFVCLPSGLLALTQTTHQERKGTMCGFVGLTLLFRRLVRFWWHLDLLKCVLYSHNAHPGELLEFLSCLCCAKLKAPLPMFWCVSREKRFKNCFWLWASIIDVNVQHVGSPVILNVESWVVSMACCTCSIHLGVNTIIEPLPQPLCTDRSERFVSVTSNFTLMVLPFLLAKGTLRLTP